MAFAYRFRCIDKGGGGFYDRAGSMDPFDERPSIDLDGPERTFPQENQQVWMHPKRQRIFGRTIP